MAKTTPYTYDRTSGRWRKNGQWCKRPSRSQLRVDRAGRYLDATGKRVPDSALAARKAKKKPFKPKRIVLRMPKRLPKHIPDGSPVTDKQLLSSTFDNQRDPALAGEVLRKTVRRKSRRAQLPTDDITIYQYGVQFVNNGNAEPSIEKVERLVSQMADAFPDYEFKYSTDSVHVILGTGAPISTSKAQAGLDTASDDLVDIWRYLTELWDGESGWFVIAENDELAGGS